MPNTNRFSPQAFPRFLTIAPTSYLPLYGAYDGGDYQTDESGRAVPCARHLVLAHLVDTDPVYADYYANRSKLGETIIMDNGAFELGESYTPNKLLGLGARCGAHAIVLPDYPGRPPEETINAAKEFAPLFKEEGYATMFVPQSERGDMEGWIGSYSWAADDDLIDIIGMSILGIPNAIPEIPAAYARVVMSAVLIDRNLFADKYHHYLGLNAGPNLELPALMNMGVLNSCDSSGPVWAGILGHEYSANTDSFLSTKKVKAHVQFDYPNTNDSETHRRIQINLGMTADLMQAGRDQYKQFNVA